MPTGGAELAAEVGGGTAELRHVAVLFADLEGFTHLCERLDPEEVVETLDRIYDRLGEEVARYGGHIDKVLGDGLMVLFGAPTAHEDDCMRAVMAGLAMQRAVGELQPWIRKRLGQGLGLRVGVDAGPVVYGAIGPGKAAATVIGDAANVAARLQQVAAPGQVVISGRVRRLAGWHIQARQLGTVQLEGRRAALSAHLALAPCVPLAGDAISPGETLVGRDAEMQMLTAEYGRTAQGQTTLVLVSGEAGIGKTRLLREFVARLEVMEANLRPLAIQIRNWWEVGSTYRPCESLLGALGLRVEHPVLGATALGRHRMRHEARTGAAATGSEQLLEALGGFCRRMPVVVLVDDWDWAEPGDCRRLMELVRGSAEWPVMFVLAGRRIELETLAELAAVPVLQLKLQPLGTRDCWRLLQQHPAASALPPDACEALVQRSGGNPAHLIESVEALIEEGALVASGEGWVVREGQALHAVPESLRNSVLSRLDALEPAAKELLRLCSVLGDEVTAPVLSQVSGLAPEEVSRRMVPLLEAGLLAAEATERKYLFRSDLVRKVAYDTMLRRQRRELHRRAALCLEEDPETSSEDLARHCVKAGLADKAMRYGIDAGEALLRRGEPERAAELLSELEGLVGDGSPDERVRLLESLAEAYITQGECQAGIERLLEALGLARAPSVRGRLMGQLGWACAIQGQADRAMRHYQQARTLLDLGGDKSGQAMVAAGVRLLYDRP